MLATVNLEKGEGSYVNPDFLPDGKNLLFTIGLSTGYQTALLSLETGERKVVLENARQARYLPTGHLIYVQGATGNLMAAPFDLAALEVTGDAVPVVQEVSHRSATFVDYAISDNGTLVYVPDSPSASSQHSLVWVDRVGKETLVSKERREFGSPRISPDGTQVAVAIGDGGMQNLWIYDLGSESFRRLTFESGSLETWSPDGTWIIFQEQDENGHRMISRQLADGSGPVEHLTVPNPGSMMPGSLTPDGSVLVFTEASQDILVLQMEGDSEPQPFITSPNPECCAKFSPDGQWVAYVSQELGPNHVYVSPYPEPDVKWLVSDEEGGGEPVWSPDGTELFYRSGDKMMLVPVQTEPTFNAGKPEILFERRYVKSRRGTPGYQYYDISPDGKRFLMIKEEALPEAAAQINVILNWFEELKRLAPTN